MNEQKEPEKHESRLKMTGSSLAKGMIVISFTTGYIFGPLLIFGGIGWWLTKKYDNLLFVFVALVIALIISNILIFKNTNKVVNRISKKFP